MRNKIVVVTALVFTVVVSMLSGKVNASNDANYTITYHNENGISDSRDAQIVQSYQSGIVAVGVDGVSYKLDEVTDLNFLTAGVETVLSDINVELEEVNCGD